MKTDGFLRWAKKGKNEINKIDCKNWIHSPESLVYGHVAYLVKFLGFIDAERPKGIDVVQEAIHKLQFSQQLRKAEGQRTPKVELTVSVDDLAIREPKGKHIQHRYPLHHITYCAVDKTGKKFFCFIAKSAQQSHVCHVFVSNNSAEEITLTIGQAFDLAYGRYFEPRLARSQEEGRRRELGHTKEDDSQQLERQNDILRRRLLDLSALIETNKLSAYLTFNGISSVLDLTNDNYSSLTSPTFSSPTEELISVLPKKEAEIVVQPFKQPVYLHTDGIQSVSEKSSRPSVGRLIFVENDDDDFNPRSHQDISPNVTVPRNPVAPRKKTSPSVLVIPQSKMAVFVQQKPPNKEERPVRANSNELFVDEVDPFGMVNFGRLASPNSSACSSSSFVASPFLQ